MKIHLDAKTSHILETLNRAGFEAYAVGGHVRDSILGKESFDVDICTSAQPFQVKKLFDTVLPTGEKHGTMTVLIQGTPFEITTFRLDGSYRDARHPDSVRFSTDLRGDCARRDFTVNAMAADLDGQVYDFYNGQQDLRDGVIRCVGKPEVRFREDALRILRALRFAATLDFSIEPETDAAIRRLYPRLRAVSAERILAELKKLLCGRGVRRVLLAYPEIVCFLIPEMKKCVGLSQHNPHHIYDVYEHIVRSVEATPADWMLRMTMLLHDIGKGECFSLDENGVGHFYGHAAVGVHIARAVLDRLRCDTATRDRILRLIKLHDVPYETTPRSARRLLNRLGKEDALALIAVKRADDAAHAPENNRLPVVDALEREILAQSEADACFSLRRLAVNGEDIKRIGWYGKDIGTELTRLLYAVIDDVLPNDKAALLADSKKQFEKKPQHGVQTDGKRYGRRNGNL
ncbi:MAG: HD domain-containing protein [Eubacteriales bacterium]|nr:HD domain-containing protein [Eubacteriales bacterium]